MSANEFGHEEDGSRPFFDVDVILEELKIGEQGRSRTGESEGKEGWEYDWRRLRDVGISRISVFDVAVDEVGITFVDATIELFLFVIGGVEAEVAQFEMSESSSSEAKETEDGFALPPHVVQGEMGEDWEAHRQDEFF